MRNSNLKDFTTPAHVNRGIISTPRELRQTDRIYESTRSYTKPVSDTIPLTRLPHGKDPDIIKKE